MIGAAYSVPPIQTNDHPLDDASIFTRVFDLEIECLKDTASNVDREVFSKVVRAIAGAERVVLFGMGSTAPLCAMAGYRLLYFGFDANWSADPMVTTMLAGFLQPLDVAVGISYSGRTRITVEALKLAASRGATTVALTTVAGSPITDVAALTLVAFAPNVALGSGQFAARVAGMALLDAMVAAVSWAKYEGHPPRMEEVVAIQGDMHDLPAGRARSRRGHARSESGSARVEERDE